MGEEKRSKKKKREYIERSERRSGYRPKASARKSSPWDIVRTVLSCLLGIVCFPLGLAAIWTCRTGAGTKLLLTIVTGVLFFALTAFALTVETDIPMVTRAQERCLDVLAKVEVRIEQKAYTARQIAENIPPAAQKVCTPALKWAQGVVEHAQGNVAAVREHGAEVVQGAQQKTLDTIYALELAPTPAPTPTPLPTPKPAPTPTPTSVPTPTPVPTETPAPDPNSTVYQKPGDSVFHKKADCAAAVGALPIQRSIAVMRGAKECAECFGQN